MRALIFILLVVFSSAAAAGESLKSPATPFTIVGTVREGVFEGPAELFTSGTTKRAAGAYDNGKPEGSWSFWDSRGSRIAVFTFHEGILEGPTKLYFGSFGAREAAGKLKVGGTMKSGNWDGVVPSWYPDGSKRTERIYESGKLVRALGLDRDGSSYAADAAMEQAQHDDEADRELITVLTSIIREAPAHAHQRTL